MSQDQVQVQEVFTGSSREELQVQNDQLLKVNARQAFRIRQLDASLQKLRLKLAEAKGDD